jgi:hypothetical protein
LFSTKQHSNKATNVVNNKTTNQQSNITTKVGNNKAANQQNKETTKQQNKLTWQYKLWFIHVCYGFIPYLINPHGRVIT